jgi:phosphoribosylaminoimidazolecarboxamide formyltransferase/IMP cyclohydrolase
MVESFYEIVLAPSFDTEALEILKSKKALRIIEYNRDYREKYEYFSVEGGLLKQEVDDLELKLGSEMTANGVSPDADQLVQLQLAFACVRHVRSNAIVIVKDGQLIGVGAGQMSRVDAASLAVSRAQAHGHDLTGAVAASDAFFPFPDSVEILADAGITAIVAPAGAKKDEEICEVSAKRGVALLFALSRHFRH